MNNGSSYHQHTRAASTMSNGGGVQVVAAPTMTSTGMPARQNSTASNLNLGVGRGHHSRQDSIVSQTAYNSAAAGGKGFRRIHVGFILLTLFCVLAFQIGAFLVDYGDTMPLRTVVFITSALPYGLLFFGVTVFVLTLLCDAEHKKQLRYSVRIWSWRVMIFIMWVMTGIVWIWTAVLVRRQTKDLHADGDLEKQSKAPVSPLLAITLPLWTSLSVLFTFELCGHGLGTARDRDSSSGSSRRHSDDPDHHHGEEEDNNVRELRGLSARGVAGSSAMPRATTTADGVPVPSGALGVGAPAGRVSKVPSPQPQLTNFSSSRGNGGSDCPVGTGVAHEAYRPEKAGVPLPSAGSGYWGPTVVGSFAAPATNNTSNSSGPTVMGKKAPSSLPSSNQGSPTLVPTLPNIISIPPQQHQSNHTVSSTAGPSFFEDSDDLCSVISEAELDLYLQEIDAANAAAPEDKFAERSFSPAEGPESIKGSFSISSANKRKMQLHQQQALAKLRSEVGQLINNISAANNQPTVNTTDLLEITKQEIKNRISAEEAATQRGSASNRSTSGGGGRHSTSSRRRLSLMSNSSAGGGSTAPSGRGVDDITTSRMMSSGAASPQTATIPPTAVQQKFFSAVHQQVGDMVNDVIRTSKEQAERRERWGVGNNSPDSSSSNADTQPTLNEMMALTNQRLLKMIAEASL